LDNSSALFILYIVDP